MRTILCMLGGFCVAISGCASKTAAATRPADTTKTIAADAEESPKTVPMPSGRGNDFARMAEIIAFNAEQRKAFDAAVKKRNEGYDAWANSPRGIRYQELRTAETAARRQRDEAKLKDIQPELESLRAEQEKVRTDLRRELNKVLSLDQQRQWASHALFLRATSALDRTALSESQKKEAKSITDRIAADRVKEGTADTDPYLLLDEPAVKQATEEIQKITKRL